MKGIYTNEEKVKELIEMDTVHKEINKQVILRVEAQYWKKPGWTRSRRCFLLLVPISSKKYRGTAVMLCMKE